MMSVVHEFFGHGKLLLTGEYLVLKGADALALPTFAGQSLKVTYRKSYAPEMTWVSRDYLGRPWFEASFDIWHFRMKKEWVHEEMALAGLGAKDVGAVLEKILYVIRQMNPHFLREENMHVSVETQLGFPLEWGLGSSSTLIYNMAQWAHVGPFELLEKSHGGSGYDIACASADGPLIYKRDEEGPCWFPVDFYPSFHEHLAFLYLGKKQNSREAIDYFKSLDHGDLKGPILDISAISRDLLAARDLRNYDRLISDHENIMASLLNLPKVKDLYFKNFPGTVKSLGAWGGDFVLVSFEQEFGKAKEYFSKLGFDVMIPFKEMVCPPRHIFQKK